MRRFIVLCLLLLTIPTFAQDTPEAAPLIDTNGQTITNILLMGSATENTANNPGLADTLMMVSVNMESGHIALVSIPRDLYVYVPEYGMYKINQAYFLAERHEAGTGIPTLYATIRHNLGIEIDYYARADFASFPRIVDSLGGIDITVDCTIQDWRLKEPDLDKHIEENWEMFTLRTGLHHMDGDTALWYVRSRRTSNDLDRNRRQQDVLRAVWRRIRSEGLLENFPSLWEQFNAMIETDLTLRDTVQFLPLLLDLDAAGIEYYTFRINKEVRQGYTDDEGRFILTAIPEAVAEMMQQVVSPPTKRRIHSALPRVAIYNGSGVPGLDYVAAHRLEREGFVTFITGEYTHPRQYNLVVDYTGASRNNPVGEIQRVLRITDQGLQTEPNPARDYDYALYIGYTYQFYSCTYPVEQPEMTPEPEVAEQS
jgi:LCP family protein required for cell wall assembly